METWQKMTDKDRKYQHISGAIDIFVDWPLIFLKQYPQTANVPLILSVDELEKINEVVKIETKKYKERIQAQSDESNRTI